MEHDGSFEKFPCNHCEHYKVQKPCKKNISMNLLWVTGSNKVQHQSRTGDCQLHPCPYGALGKKKTKVKCTP